MDIYLVGGAVRDKLLNIKPKDYDWVVTNSNESEMIKLGFIKVGTGFPVFLHPSTHEEYALARKEIKTGTGHRQFQFDTDRVNLFDDLMRRDLTINAMAIDKHGTLHDPFDGKKDINNKVLRHIGNAFSEDPLRVLRVARFAAQYNYLEFSIAKETLNIMKKIVENNELLNLSGERIYKEFVKSFQTRNPEIFILILKELGVFNIILKPLNKVSRKQIKLLHTIAYHRCTNIPIYLYALLSPIKKYKEIVNILKTLKLEKEIQKKVIDVHMFYSDVLKIMDYDEKHILKLLKNMRALQNNNYFKDLIQIFLYIASIEKKNIINIYKIINVVKKINDFPYKKHIHNKNIAETVEKIQLKIIAQAK